MAVNQYKAVHRHFAATVACVLLIVALVSRAGLLCAADAQSAADWIAALGGRTFRDTATPGRPVLEVDFSGTGIENDVLAVLSELPELQVLDVSATCIDDQGLSHLKHVPKLRSFRAHGCSIGDDGLAALGKLSDLDSLDLTGSRITDAGLAQLSACIKLRELTLTGTSVSDAGLKPLASLPELCVLGLFATRVRGPGLAEFKHLISLDLRATDIDDEGLANLAQLTKLTVLDLSRTLVKGEGLRHLQGMKSLRSLRIASAYNVKYEAQLDIQHLPALTSLRELDLTNSIWAEGLPALSALTGLERLVLDDCMLGVWCPVITVEDEERAAKHQVGLPRYLRPLVNLKDLRLSHTGITDEWLDVIATMSKLESLDLSNNALTDDGLSQLSRLTNLERLNLSSILDLKGDYAMLGGLNRLRDVKLDCCHVSAAGVRTLVELPQLRRVSMFTDYGRPHLQYENLREVSTRTDDRAQSGRIYQSSLA